MEAIRILLTWVSVIYISIIIYPIIANFWRYLLK